MNFATVHGVCPPRGKVTRSDGSGQMRIYTPSVISAMQEHLRSTDPELGGPLENLVPIGSSFSSSFFSFIICSLLDPFSPLGCISRKSLLSLGVPGLTGLHHGGRAGRADHGPDWPGDLGCITRYRLVYCQPEQSPESRLGGGYGKMKCIDFKCKYINIMITITKYYYIIIMVIMVNYIMVNLCLSRWRSHVWFPVNLSGQFIFFLQRQVGSLCA